MKLADLLFIILIYTVLKLIVLFAVILKKAIKQKKFQKISGPIITKNNPIRFWLAVSLTAIMIVVLVITVIYSIYNYFI